MENCHMVPTYKKLLVGFSGGADSLCLMEVLRELAPKYGLTLYAVHVHHGIRGLSADQDAAFVKAYCEKYAIPCEICYVSAKETAREQKIGLEEAGRQLRYSLFAEMGRKWGTDAIAVAHHQNDQAETMLFQMARGSSLTGAGGIRPVNDGIIRPLLCVDKKEILAFLQERGLTWREDESNQDREYTRNSIRQDILPLLESRVNENSVAHMATLALELQETENYLRTVEDELWQRLVKENEEILEVSRELLREPPLFWRRLLHRALKKQAGGGKDLTREHVYSILRLFEAPCGKSVSLPRGLTAWGEETAVCIGRQTKCENTSCYDLTIPGRLEVGDMQVELCIKSPDNVKISENTYTKWLDYDKIKNGLSLRKRRSGDTISIDDGGHHKKLKDFMIDRKIPRYRRDDFWIIAKDSSVVWVIGDRIGAEYKVTEKTKRVLEIRVTGDRYE